MPQEFKTTVEDCRVAMVKCSIPVQTSCSGQVPSDLSNQVPSCYSAGVEIRSKTLGKGAGEKAVPAITVSLSIDIPVEEHLCWKMSCLRRWKHQFVMTPAAFCKPEAYCGPHILSVPR